MTRLNKTNVDHSHRIFVSSPDPKSDRTGIYILCLLCLLGFILIFYLCYNFISYRRYRSHLRKKKKSRVNYFIPIELQPRTSLPRLPLRTSGALSLHRHHFHPLKRSPSIDPYPLTTRLVSDL